MFILNFQKMTFFEMIVEMTELSFFSKLLYARLIDFLSFETCFVKMFVSTIVYLVL